MSRTVVACDGCGQQLSVPQKNGEVECPKCNNVITLAFEPRVVNTPPWLNRKLGFALMLAAAWIWNNTIWFRTTFIDDSGLFQGLAQLLCFAGVLLVAFADVIRNRGRLFGEQVNVVQPVDLDPSKAGNIGQIETFISPKLGAPFYIAAIVPLLMIPVSFQVPLILNWCSHPAFRECTVVSDSTFLFMLFLPLGTALIILNIGMRKANGPDNGVLMGAKISTALTFAFFAMMTFLMLTVHP